MPTGKFRNEDHSIFFFIKNISLNGKTIGETVSKIVDGYPYNELENGTLVIPCVSIEHVLTSDEGVGELGASWFRRSWEIDIFANTDTQRDELADRIFQALDVAIPIKDYSVGFRKDTGKSLVGADLRIIEYINAENRRIRPSWNFNLFAKIKYWRNTVSFDTISTQAS